MNALKNGTLVNYEDECPQCGSEIIAEYDLKKGIVFKHKCGHVVFKPNHFSPHNEPIFYTDYSKAKAQNDYRKARYRY